MTDHVPVLTEETLRLLDPRAGEVAVDLTAGRGGHAVLLAERVRGGEPAGRVVLFDLDRTNLDAARERVAATGVRVDAFPENFARVGARIAALGLRANVVLADLGFASTQMDDPERGFSFRADGPLDMRFARGTGPSAAELLAVLPERELADLLRHVGEEPLGGKIARKVVRTRASEPIDTTAKLAGLVVEAYGSRARTSRMHPATRTFMALRIAVNDELGSLRLLLESIARGAEPGGWLDAGARVAVISFHSLEDRLVKRAFVALAERGRAERLTKRPVTAGVRESEINPRARSAKLRVVRMDDPDTGRAGGTGSGPRRPRGTDALDHDT